MAAGSIERVQVILQAITGQFARSMNRAGKGLRQVSMQMQNFGQVMQTPMKSFKKMDERAQLLRTSGGRLAKGFRVMTHGMRGFRMEMLGVMFFGMMMQRFFIGLLQPVMDAFGVFDLFRLMLLVLFLPIMETLFPMMLKIMDWFMNLPEPVKEAIGWIVIIGAVLATLLFIIGAFALGIGSLILAFPGIGVAIGLLGVALLPILVIAALVIAIAIAIWVAWKENFMNIRTFIDMIWKGIEDIFEGAMDVIIGIVELFTALFEGDLDKLLAAVKKIVGGVLKSVMGFMKILLGFGATIVIAIIRIFIGLTNIIVQIQVRIRNWLGKFFRNIIRSFFKWGGNMITGLAKGIASMFQKVKDSILGLFPKWARNMIWNSGRLVIDIFQNVTENIKRVFSGGPRKNDFIWRPGQSPISINPNDTLVGFKGGGPFASGGETNITNNFYGFTKDELKRELDDRDRRLVDDIRRIVKQ